MGELRLQPEAEEYAAVEQHQAVVERENQHL
jgi:hypothetical protein